MSESAFQTPESTETHSLMGVTIRTMVPTSATKGMLCQLEYSAPPGFAGPPLHVHRVMTEMFTVVEGELSLTAGHEEVALGAGRSIVIPVGTAHRFWNASEKPVRFHVLLTPGEGFEGYFGELFALIRAQPVWPPKDPAVLKGIQELAERCDTYNP